MTAFKQPCAWNSGRICRTRYQARRLSYDAFQSRYVLRVGEDDRKRRPHILFTRNLDVQLVVLRNGFHDR